MQFGSASKLGGASENALEADINVTPLVDVCLVLLIIFMVVAPILVPDAGVLIPETTRPEKMPESSRQLDIVIRQDETVFIGRDWVPGNQVLARLEHLRGAHPDRTVVIKGDRRVQYAEVRKVMRLVNQAGFSGVGLVFHKKGDHG